MSEILLALGMIFLFAWLLSRDPRYQKYFMLGFLASLLPYGFWLFFRSFLTLISLIVPVSPLTIIVLSFVLSILSTGYVAFEFLRMFY